ncbi:MAG: transposase [Alphaproteobacteria bacterium]|nr:transposase [Alphaproteobacteria bacterium]
MSYACEWRKSWKSRHGSLKRGLNTKVHVALDAHGMPLKILISDGNVHDKRQGIGQ